MSLQPVRYDVEGINSGNAWNTLELSCVGTAITARVNGSVVGSARDDHFSDGKERTTSRQPLMERRTRR